MYFNMVLKRGGTSSWGWQQNSLVVIDPSTKQVAYTPEFYLMKHLSRYVGQGAHKMKTMGNDRTTLAFRNVDGSLAVVFYNSNNKELKVNIADGENRYNQILLPPRAAVSVLMNTNQSNGVRPLGANAKPTPTPAYYTLNGVKTPAPTRPGIYIHQGRKEMKN